jgi:ATP-dependent Zn protease
MQQSALNLIAIAVFTTTLFSLLGPMLHISPIVPTILTVGMMGLSAIDNFAWESKGTNLLLDTFTSAEERERIVHHEAGHFFVAHYLKIPVADYTLTVWEAFKKQTGGAIGTTIDESLLSSEQLTPQELPLFVDRFATVCMAGIAAENIIYGEAKGGREDLQQIRKILQNAGIAPTNYQQKERWAYLQAKNALSEHQDAYLALVAAMKNRTSVKECQETIERFLVKS